MPDPEPCWGIACGITLDEVVIGGSTNSEVYTHHYYTPQYGHHNQWGRHVNNYTTMGIAYANHYKRQATLDYWNNVIIEDSGPKIDPIEETKCLDRLEGGKLTIYVRQPNENSLDLTGENQVGHVYVGIEQDGKRRCIWILPTPRSIRYRCYGREQLCFRIERKWWRIVPC